MGSCSDCNTSDTCRGDHGSYEDESNGGYVRSYEEDNCWDQYFSSYYSVTHTVNPRNGSNEPYDEVHGAYKNYFLNSWFDSVPDPLIHDTCDPSRSEYDSYADSVEFYIRHGSGWGESDYRFGDPRPDGNGNYESWIMDTVLAIVQVAGSLSSHPYAAGAAAVASFLQGGWGSPVDLSKGEFDDGDSSTTRRYWWWDMDTDNMMPSGPCDTSSVRFAVEPGINSATDVPLQTYTRYNFYVAEHTAIDCHCSTGGYDFYLHQSDWLSNSINFDIVG